MKNKQSRVAHIVLALGLSLTGCVQQRPLTATPTATQHSLVFSGEVNEGRAFIRGFGDRFALVLTPIDHGWLIEVRDERGVEDIARLTPPWQGINDRYLEGWHFRNSDNTGPNEVGLKNVNAPQHERSFIFSPEVSRTIGGADARSQPSYDDVERIGEFGRGTLTIVDYRLRDLVSDEAASFAWMNFRVELSWTD